VGELGLEVGEIEGERGVVGLEELEEDCGDEGEDDESRRNSFRRKLGDFNLNLLLLLNSELDFN